MSYIRWSTKVPGQKNTSRTYAWSDIAGGIRIAGRNVNGEAGGEVLISYPEMYYMCTNFLNQLRDDTKGRVSDFKQVKRNHRGFWKRWDKDWEEQIKNTDFGKLFKTRKGK